VATNLYVLGSSSITGNLAVGSDSVLSGSLTLGSTLIALQSATISGSVQIGTGLVVGGSVVLGGSITVGSSASIGIDLAVGGQATVTGGLNVGSSAVVQGTLTVGTQLTVNGFATIAGDIWIGSDTFIGGGATVSGGASISQNLWVGGTITAPYANISNITAQNALILTSLIVEGNYVNTTVSTTQDLQMNLGLGESRQLLSFAAGTFTANAQEDTAPVWAVGDFVLVTAPDVFTGTIAGSEIVLEISALTFDPVAHTYVFSAVAQSDGVVTPVAALTDFGYPAAYDFTSNIVTVSLVYADNYEGEAGLFFNTYSTLSVGTVTNSTRSLVFSEEALNMSRLNSEVIDMNLVGGTRLGSRDDPAYSVNGKPLLSTNRLFVDTKSTLSGQSGMYLTGDANNLDAIGSWKMVISTVTGNFQVLYRGPTNWQTAFSVSQPL
jgi:carbonic anhydrase/acetyltransferase-like protein (isoleucine patch superfamily)